MKQGGGRVLVRFPLVRHLFIDIPLTDKGGGGREIYEGIVIGYREEAPLVLSWVLDINPGTGRIMILVQFSA